MHFDPKSYAPAVAGLLDRAGLSELGPGTPDESRRAALAALRLESLVEPDRRADRQMALACLAGLWLAHDFLDESHRISQDLETSTGSFWHGIMHRREGDFENAKYWFRRVRQHPIFDDLRREAARMAREAGSISEAAYLADQPEWDPLKFVDLCRRAIDGPQDLRTLCMQIQKREWELLFDDCYEKAKG
ncbi:MAG: hypothetical protein WDZ48_04870 [Pirellulales bacterium]